MKIDEIIHELGYGPSNQDKWAQAIEEAIEALETIAKGYVQDGFMPIGYHDKVYAKLQKRYFDLLERTRWIPVSDRLPEKDRSVFVFTDCGETDFAYIGHTTGHWFTNGMLLIPNVTHWMPLPEPPQEV